MASIVVTTNMSWTREMFVWIRLWIHSAQRGRLCLFFLLIGFRASGVLMKTWKLLRLTSGTLTKWFLSCWLRWTYQIFYRTYLMLTACQKTSGRNSSQLSSLVSRILVLIKNVETFYKAFGWSYWVTWYHFISAMWLSTVNFHNKSSNPRHLAYWCSILNL